MLSGTLGFQQPPSLCPYCIIHPSTTTPPIIPMAPSEMPLCSYDSLHVLLTSPWLPSASLAPLMFPVSLTCC